MAKRKSVKKKACASSGCDTMHSVGKWGFLVGVILAIILGVSGSLGSNLAAKSTVAWMTTLLIVLGLIVGFLNISASETNQFLFAALVLVVISGLSGNMLGHITAVGNTLKSIFSGLLLFIVPATLVVALKAIIALEKS